MATPLLDQHADFLLATRDRRVAGRDVLLNQATKPRYFYDQMFKTHGLKFKGGTKLVERIQSKDPATFKSYSPNQEFQPKQIDTLQSIAVNWAFYEVDYTIIDETAELNSGDDNAYVDYIMSLEQGCRVDAANGLETLLWADPDSSKMESPSGSTRQESFSILCFITRDGGAPSSTNGGIATGSSNWSTLQGLNPSSNSWYQNQSRTYTAATPDHPEDGLVAAFDRQVLEVQFEMPDGVNSYVENGRLQNYCIATDLEGQAFYKARLRELNDRMERLHDPKISGPQYEGIPVKYVSELNRQSWTAGQSDYLFINLNWLVPWFHTDYYMKEKITTGGPRQPNSTVVYKFTWMNLICRNRREQGRVYAA